MHLEDWMALLVRGKVESGSDESLSKIAPDSSAELIMA